MSITFRPIREIPEFEKSRKYSKAGKYLCWVPLVGVGLMHRSNRLLAEAYEAQLEEERKARIDGVFPTWAEAMAAIEAQRVKEDGAISVVFDDSERSPASVPPGSYDLNGVVLRGGRD